MDWLFSFPSILSINLEAIDDSVKAFSMRFSGFFDAIRDGLTLFISSIYSILTIIPWWVILILVFIAGWKINKKIRTGFLYALLLFLVGAMGLWNMMNETLSIVLAAVFISLILGFPLGILLAECERAGKIVRPILDTMQTMPVFVYLIPAVLFFGLGKAPAVIATTLYAIVPIVRLTTLGIKQVDFEVVEAAIAFGSTRLQRLWKVQIPQAMPTIMTGINQTLMMAMAMVVTCSMIGANGLGMEVLISVNRLEMGRGLIAGTAVVIVAIILDRITQSWGKTDTEANND